MNDPWSRLEYYLRQRSRATAMRDRGYHAPWTDDPVIRRAHFCSVIRDDDRTSREARRLIAGLPDEGQQLAAALWFRLVNRADTAEYVLKTVPNPMQSLAVLDALRELSQVFNTQAYRVQVRGGLWHLPEVARMIARAGKMSRDGWQPRRLARITRESVSGQMDVGPFIAYQITQDLRWLRGPYEDENEWALIGPGALRGLRRLSGEYEAYQAGDGKSAAEARRFASGQVNQDQAWGKYRKTLHRVLEIGRGVDERFNMFEAEHNMCEFDKYERITSGETPGRKFKPKDDA